MKHKSPTSTPDQAKKRGVVRTQNAAASAMQVTSKTISAWKAEGGESAGFRPDGTVDLDKLHTWAEARRENREGTVSNKELKLLEEIRKLRIANDQADGLLVPIAIVHAQIDKCVARARAILESKLLTELPPKCDGLPTEKIAEHMSKTLDEILDILGKKETYASTP